MLRHLGRTLAEAIAGSSDAHRVLEHLRAEGYGLYLLLDRHGRLDPTEIRALLESDGDGRDGAVREMWNRQTGALETPETPSPPAPEPTFRINQADLAFLRSVGIDPTRQVKSRTKDRSRK